ncbi:MAG: ThiF family adenylyltransferase [Bacteroidales bacterium]|nr:ThiF family adenylyltransferase [Bacteroidales bacterium]HOK98094.1 ThiF family adenylyltransferase [Bacteroidales bacterium]HPO64713.1 ThiF family adenylyltransferase [Bacteroidales bacterium]
MHKIFSEIELRRYAKQISSQEIGLHGQEKLKKSRILVVGAGSMGIPVLQYLAAAGVGVLGICDYKTIQEADFPSQIMYGLGDLGKLKTIVAKEKIQVLNPYVTPQIHNIQLREENTRLICDGYDLIVDCTNEKEVLPSLLQQTNVPILVGQLQKWQGTIWLFPSEKNRTLPDDFSLQTLETNIWGSLYGIIGCLLAYQAIQAVLSDYKIQSQKIVIDWKTYAVN